MPGSAFTNSPSGGHVAPRGLAWQLNQLLGIRLPVQILALVGDHVEGTHADHGLLAGRAIVLDHRRVIAADLTRGNHFLLHPVPELFKLRDGGQLGGRTRLLDQCLKEVGTAFVLRGCGRILERATNIAAHLLKDAKEFLELTGTLIKALLQFGDLGFILIKARFHALDVVLKLGQALAAFFQEPVLLVALFDEAVQAFPLLLAVAHLALAHQLEQLAQFLLAVIRLLRGQWRGKAQHHEYGNNSFHSEASPGAGSGIRIRFGAACSRAIFRPSWIWLL